MDKTQICVVCNVKLPIDRFYMCNKDGRLYRRCKSCEASRCKEYKLKTGYQPTQKRAEQKVAMKSGSTKTCSTCNIERSQMDFESRRNQCRTCRIEYLKHYHSQDDVKERVNNNSKKNKCENPHALLKARLRARLGTLFKRHDVKKTNATLDLVGCSWVQLVQHIESQFVEDMHWNHPKLSIDHKVPRDAFDLTDIAEQKRCFNYLNLRPMWLKDNIKKGNKILPEFDDLFMELKQMFTESKGTNIVSENSDGPRVELGYGKNPLDNTMGNPQPSS
jgi:hypothetical protein